MTQNSQETGNSNILDQLVQQVTAAKGIPELAAAFVGAWGEIPHVVKNASNPHFGNDYADLSAVLDVIKPVFARHKLALLQAPGPMRDDRISMECVVLHASGQHFRFVTELPIGSKPTAQAAGSAYTYARRYQAQAIGGMAPVDDDGEAASAPPPTPPKKSKPDKPKTTEEATTEPQPGTNAKLVERITACTSVEQLETECKADVKAAGDKAIADVYVAQLRGLRAAARGGGK